MGEKEIFIRLVLALIIGGVTGIERERLNKFAGFRTHILVSLGSCISSIISLELFLQYNGVANLDPARLSAQVLSGIGFLGAGTILKTSGGVRGLTTAAGIWSTACIGIAIGYGYYFLAIVSWIFLLVVLCVLKYIDMLYKKKRSESVVLTIKDNEAIPRIMEILDEMNLDTKKFDIEKKSSNLVLKFTFDNGSKEDRMEFLGKVASIQSKIAIEYTS
ncbi:MgtC/SapB family protein [Romboutsia weinsteinii]|uniref:MgtC/SapB family protein n=1 Tax=Romboutsia weinsteinii TaxID=2020949 RepID=A0A371IYA2_9FIRM|nr:MgtC/SapB family protein [Romboutsia weinsteinii]RDY25446.1 MgtC/SapB family protein [Romboutsia weinsteinii]